MEVAIVLPFPAATIDEANRRNLSYRGKRQFVELAAEGEGFQRLLARDHLMKGVVYHTMPCNIQ